MGTARALAALVLLALSLIGSWGQMSAVMANCSLLNCGWSANCIGGNCSCPAEFVLQPDGRNCRNATCTPADCLQCDRPDHCLKCAAFMSKSSGSCLGICVGSAEQQGDNLLCTETTDDGSKVSVIVAVFAGAGAGLFICCLVIAIVCLYMRRNRRNVNLQNKNYTVRQMETGYVKQYSIYDNSGFESDSPTANGIGKIDPLDYVAQLERLRLHTDSLMTLIGQLRAKAKAMNPNDARVPTYTAMIHRLFRVLALLHKKEQPAASIPSDAMSLIQWAYQMLEDYSEQQLTTSDIDVDDMTIAQISSVDLDTVDTISPVYMTPESSHTDLPLTSPYSTSQVPLASEKQQYANTLGRKSGFATINRATSMTNAALLSSIEADEIKFSLPPDSADPKPALPTSSSGLSREDMQIFLINAPVSNSLARQPDVIIEYNTMPSLGKRNASAKRERHSISKETFVITGSINSSVQKPSTFLPPQQLNRQKKNIITNPKTASLGRKAGSNYSVPNKGYFANGHYYDPNPMPALEPEIYAPGSNYSDRSNIMSTFLGDAPSGSDQSDFGDNMSDNSGGDLEVFPFDLKDATEPVEV